MPSSVCGFGGAGRILADHARQRACVARRQPAEAEGVAAHLHRRTVELDRLLDGLRADRHAAQLIGIAQQEHVRRDGVAKQLHGRLVRIEVMHGRLAGPLHDRMPQRRAGHLEVGLAREIGRRHLVVGEHHRRVVGLDGLEHLVGGRHDQIAAEHEVGARDARADRMDVVRRLGNAHVAGNRAALLREPRHVDRAEALALEVRRLAEHGRQRHHAGAAHARHQHGVGCSIDGSFGSGRLASMLATPVSPTGFLAFLTLAPCTVTKLGQKPLRQEKSLLQAD